MTLPLPEETPLNLQEETRWELIDSVTLNAQLTQGGTSYNPIPEWFCPSTFISPILRIQAVSSDTTNRKLMGRLLQMQEIPSGSSNNVSLASRKIWRGSQILRFGQDIEGSYSIQILPRYYVQNLTLLVYEFL